MILFKNNFISSLRKMILLSLVISIVACSEDDSSGGGIEFSDNFSFLKIFDVGNDLTGNDIYISISTTGFNPSSIRILIIENGTANSLTPASIQELGVSQYASISIANSNFRGQLTNIQTTANGSALANDKDYQLIAYSLEHNLFSRPSNSFTLGVGSALNGSYTGTWNDNFYTNFGISANISGEGNSYSGDFYYTSTFTACCGAQTDGDISFQIENNQIQGFVYDQNLITYMNGCPGLYQGSGQMEDPITLVINFTGEDCDGIHVGGIIRLERLR